MRRVCVNPVNKVFSTGGDLCLTFTGNIFIPILSIGLHTDNSQVGSVFAQLRKPDSTDGFSFFSTLYTALITIITFYINIINNPDRGIK